MKLCDSTNHVTCYGTLVFSVVLSARYLNLFRLLIGHWIILSATMITAVKKETQIRPVKWKLFNTDPIDHFHIDHNAPCTCLPPKILNIHCLGFLLGQL